MNALARELREFPYPLIYATRAGPELYGFAAADEEVDVRACHVLPAREVVGLRAPQESIAYTAHRDGADFELVSHDLKKVALMLLKKNGAVLEQILSPLVAHTTPEHEELCAIARKAPTTHMATHYRSQTRLQWSLYEDGGRARPLLHAIRTALTGAHLMRTGEIETDLRKLADGRADVEALRTTGEVDEAHWARAFPELLAALDEAAANSPLPPAPPDDARDALDALLVRLRLEYEYGTR